MVFDKFFQKDFVALFISILLTLTTVIMVSVTDYTIETRHYIGFLVLSLCSFFYWKNKKVYRYLFAIATLAGLFQFIDFFYITFEITIIGIKFNPLFFVLILIFLLLENYEEELGGNAEREPNLGLIRGYEEKYKKKSTDDLEKISDENSPYVIEARIASKRVLDGRKNKTI